MSATGVHASARAGQLFASLGAMRVSNGRRSVHLRVSNRFAQ